MARFWDSEVILADLERGNRRIRVREVRRGDSTMIDIRLFWRDKDNNWQPTRRGLAIPIECLGPLVGALEKACAAGSAR